MTGDVNVKDVLDRVCDPTTFRGVGGPGIFFHGTPDGGDYSVLTRPLYLTKFVDRAACYTGRSGFILVLRVNTDKLVNLPSPTMCDCCKHIHGWDPGLPAGAREGEDYEIIAILPGREVCEQYLGWETPWYWELEDDE